MAPLVQWSFILYSDYTTQKHPVSQFQIEIDDPTVDIQNALDEVTRRYGYTVESYERVSLDDYATWLFNPVDGSKQRYFIEWQPLGDPAVDD